MPANSAAQYLPALDAAGNVSPVYDSPTQGFLPPPSVRADQYTAALGQQQGYFQDLPSYGTGNWGQPRAENPVLEDPTGAPVYSSPQPSPETDAQTQADALYDASWDIPQPIFPEYTGAGAYQPPVPEPTLTTGDGPVYDSPMAPTAPQGLPVLDAAGGITPENYQTPPLINGPNGAQIPLPASQYVDALGPQYAPAPQQNQYYA
tara:strand:- start:37 stop:651 length:615 start_codon:yes stop_codon:yes gene_type:complete